VLDVEAALPAAGQHQSQLDEDLATFVQWGTLDSQGDRRRQAMPQTQPVGQGANGVPTCATRASFSSRGSMKSPGS